MENIFICNGITQMIVMPQNEADRAMMLKLTNQGPLEVIYSQHPIGVLDKSIKDCLIIRPKKQEPDENT